METKEAVLEVLEQRITFRDGYGTDCVFGCGMGLCLNAWVFFRS